MEQWKEYKLSDILSIVSGFAYKGEYLGKGESLLLGMGCVSYSELFLEKGMRPYAGEFPERYSVEAGDIVLATRQQSDNLPILGMPAIVPQKFKGKKMVFGANLYKVVPKSPEFPIDYIYWLLKTPAYIRHIRSCQTGTTVRMITKANIEDYAFMCPCKEQRNQISKLLWDIEMKIVLNRRINDNLEEQAKALFKSWFVDSDRNEWVHYELGDITLITAGGDRPSKYTNKKTIECYVPIYSNGIDNEGLYGYTDVAKIHEESITISARGTIGYVCLRLEPYVPIVRLISIIPNKKELSAKYLYLWALTQNITGTGTTQQQLTVPIFRKTPISIPSDTKLKQFNSIADPLFSQIESNKKENIKLSTLRDTLLPKLMSGELSVEEVSLD